MVEAVSQVGEIPPNDPTNPLIPSVYLVRSQEAPLSPAIKRAETNESRGFFREQEAHITPDLVICASESHKRRGFIESAYNGLVPVMSHPGGEERKIPDVRVIASEKADYVLYKITQNIGNLSLVIFAGDARSNIQKVDADGHIILENKGKPQTYQELFNTFKGMAAVVGKDYSPYYSIESGSASHIIHDGESKRYLDSEESIVEFEPGVLARLSTVQGFKTYLERFDNFYSNPPYNKLYNSKISPLDLCGGLSLSVLVNMGAVRRINGINVQSPDFPRILLHSLHTALVGISPKVMRPVHPNPEAAIANWEWLVAVRNRAMQIQVIQ